MKEGEGDEKSEGGEQGKDRLEEGATSTSREDATQIRPAR